MQPYPTFRYYYSGGSGEADAVGDGQLLVGSSTGIPMIANITPGPGIAVVNSSGSITISATLADPDVAEVTSVIDTTTTSLTDVMVDSMSVIVSGAGDYVVIFSGVVDNDAPTTSTVTLSLYRDGVVVPSSVTLLEASKAEPHNVTTMAYMTGVSAGHSIELRWNVGSDTATFHERRLLVQKIRLTV